MNDNLKLDETDLNILKTIAGKPIEPFECGDLYYKINLLEKHGFIEDIKCRTTRLSGNYVTVERGYTLTEKGKNAISITRPRILIVSCAHCGTFHLEVIQRHTGKWQAICQSCGMRSPFMNSFDDVEKWVKQEAEKEENLANMRKIWGQS